MNTTLTNQFKIGSCGATVDSVEQEAVDLRLMTYQEVRDQTLGNVVMMNVSKFLRTKYQRPRIF